MGEKEIARPGYLQSRFPRLELGKLPCNPLALPWLTTLPNKHCRGIVCLHLDILRDNIADAKGPLLGANWTRGIEVSFAALGMASSFIPSGTGALNSHASPH